MKPLSHIEYKKYQEIADKVIEYLKDQGFIAFFIKYEELCQLVETAKTKNKRNNSFLRDGYLDDVCLYHALDLTKKELVWLKVSPKKENTTKQMFIYEVLNSQSAPKQCYTHFKN